jgi:hypothetical protein
MINVAMVLLSLVLPLVHLAITKGQWTRRNVLRIFLTYAFVFDVGAVGFLFGFIPHVFFADLATELIVASNFAPYNLMPAFTDTFIPLYLLALLYAYWRAGGLDGTLVPEGSQPTNSSRSA